MEGTGEKPFGATLFSRVLDLHTHIKSRDLGAATEAPRKTTERRQKKEARAERWKNTCGALKSPSESIRLKLLVREENRGNFTPALALLSWPAACSVGGNPLNVTYILIFMNALIAPLKTLPWPGGGYLYKRVRQAKKWGGATFPDSLCSERERERKKSIILIATGNNYLVDSGKWVTRRHPTPITRCEGRLVATDIQEN